MNLNFHIEQYEPLKLSELSVKSLTKYTEFALQIRNPFHS